MQESPYVKNIKFLKKAALIIGLFSYGVYLVLITYFESANFIEYSIVFLLSLIGLLTIIYQFISYWMVTGIYINAYTIFLIFFFLFNFGQCLGWLFDIHLNNEIGARLLYGYMFPEYIDIAKAQIIFIECTLLFHITILLKYKPPIFSQDQPNYGQLKNRLFSVSLFMSSVTFPISFYYVISKYRMSVLYGYRSLYYGNVVNVSDLVVLMSKAFFPCILGLLIASSYSDKTRRIVYMIFAAYSAISIMSGDRGGWIYYLVILIWLHNNYYKKIRIKKLMLYSIISYSVLAVVNAIVSVRNIGITINNITASLSNQENSPIISTIFEMGSSMGVNIVVIKDQLKYPYGNSYILAILGSLTIKIPHFLGLPYSTLTKWFSQEYLGIDWGAGFTVIAEAIVNFGIYIAPLIFIILAVLFQKVLNMHGDKNENPIQLFYGVSLSAFFINITRSTTHEFLKNVIFGILPFVAILFIFEKMALRNRQKALIRNEII